MVDERALTGDEGLDEQIGGLPRNSLIVVAGEAGTGKTNFSAQFLIGGISQRMNQEFTFHLVKAATLSFQT